ncbi:MAG TPA: cyclodeaminase/cyclohydrolase family protein [Thermoanaerobaculia bacterium]|nr:cyclodeaminase/cyclohydrolase family protein [Thermoanaerobaculia bacterium]
MTDFAKLPLERFLDEIASVSPTPGGGTAAAAAGAAGAALVEMVAALTLSREKYAAVHESVASIAEKARAARSELLELAREDSLAYDAVVAARRLPKDTEEEKKTRGEAIQESNRYASQVPMRTARAAAGLLAALPELVEKGNPNALSDAGAAALLLDAAAEGALLNVGINLSGISDQELVGAMQRETAAIQEETQRLRSHVLQTVRARF